MQLKLTIDDEIAERLTKAGKELGFNLQDYIRLICGEHVKQIDADGFLYSERRARQHRKEYMKKSRKDENHD